MILCLKSRLIYPYKMSSKGSECATLKAMRSLVRSQPLLWPGQIRAPVHTLAQEMIAWAACRLSALFNYRYLAYHGLIQAFRLRTYPQKNMNIKHRPPGEP